MSIIVNAVLVTWLGLISPDTSIERFEEPRVIDLSFARPALRKPASPGPKQTAIETGLASRKAPHTTSDAAQPARSTSQDVTDTPGSASAPALGQGPPSTAALSSALRAGLGCLHADFLHLSPEARERCAQVAAQVGPGPEVDMLAHIDPEKLALFHAQARADREPPHMAGFFCTIRFGAKGTSTLKLVEAKRLGRLPCFIVGPKATVVEDHPR